MSKSWKYDADDEDYEDKREIEQAKAIKKLAKVKQNESWIDEPSIQRGLSKDKRKKP